MMRTRPRILVDIDGFFANFIARSLPIIKQVVHDLRPNLTVEELARINATTHDDVRTYRMEEIFHMTRDEITAWHDRVKSPLYCALIPPYDGAREAIAELKKLGD